MTKTEALERASKTIAEAEDLARGGKPTEAHALLAAADKWITLSTVTE